MKILVAGWDSGGGVEAVQTVVRRAVRRGHQVRVLGTEGLRSRFESAGAGFRRVTGTLRTTTPGGLRRTSSRSGRRGPRWGVRPGPRPGDVRACSRSSAVTCVEELDREPADVVVVDTLIPSALSGAEAAGVPSVLLMHGPYLLPRAGAPPIGLGFLPARGSLGRLRDRAAWSLTMGLFRTGMPALNQARAEFGLAPLRDLVTWSLVLAGSWYAPARAMISPPMLSPATSATSGPSSMTPVAGHGTSRGPALDAPAGPGQLEQYRDAPGGLAAASRRCARTAPGSRAGDHRARGRPGGDPCSGRTWRSGGGRVTPTCCRTARPWSPTAVTAR